MIEIKGLRRTFYEHVVLKNIDLTIGTGETHGIVGENGAGKTTLFKCIAGLDEFTGSVAYDGGILKNTVGYLPTVPFYFSLMTGREYLQLVCNARDIKIPDFNRVNLFELPLDKYADTYSTGMQKKLSLTGLLLQKNEVFILDEPFNGVDISSNIMIQQILRRLKELRKTIILSSHIFSTLQDSCDFLHHLKGGEIVNSVPRGSFHLIEDDMKRNALATEIVDAIYAIS